MASPCTTRIQLIPILHHFPDLLPELVALLAALTAGNDRKGHATDKFGNVVFVAIGQRTNDNQCFVIGHQFGWHAFDFSTKKHIEHQGVHHVITVMAERDLVGTEFFGCPVNDAAP